MSTCYEYVMSTCLCALNRSSKVFLKTQPFSMKTCSNFCIFRNVQTPFSSKWLKKFLQISRADSANCTL